MLYIPIVHTVHMLKVKNYVVLLSNIHRNVKRKVFVGKTIYYTILNAPQ